MTGRNGLFAPFEPRTIRGHAAEDAGGGDVGRDDVGTSGGSLTQRVPGVSNLRQFRAPERSLKFVII